MLTKEASLLIQILKSLLQGETFFPLEVISPEIDFEKLYRTAYRNGVANMAAFLITQCDGIPQEIKTKFEHQRLQIMMQQLKCEKAFSECCDILQEVGIRGIVLKGTILKQLYPNPFMRSMGDIDIFMEEEDIQNVDRMMVEAGFSTGKIGKGNHYEYLKYDVAKIEFHPELVALESSYGKNVFLKRNDSGMSIAQALDLWNHTEPLNGNEFARQLTPEYHYLYIIMHMMNHFLSAGTGIRSVMDVWVMNHHYAETKNRKRIEQLLEDFGLLTFEKYALALADRWFDLTGNSYLPDDVDMAILDSLEEYIVGSGTYGTTEQFTYRLMGYEAGTMSKFRYLAKRFFLPYRSMRLDYPILDKYPILLPIMWMRRGVELFRKRGKLTANKMKIAANADQKTMARQKALIETMIGK